MKVVEVTSATSDEDGELGERIGTPVRLLAKREAPVILNEP